MPKQITGSGESVINSDMEHLAHSYSNTPSVNRSIPWIFVALVFVGISGCNKENAPDCFQSAGEETTVRRALDEFSEIELHDYVFIELYDSTERSIEITGPRNLLNDIVTDVRDHRLEIRNDNTCNWVRSFKHRITVRIYAPSFDRIENFGTGDITSINPLHQPVFELDNRHAAGLVHLHLEVDTARIRTHTGVADVLLTGNADVAEYFEQGYGWIDARNFHAQQAYANNSSVNNIYLDASQYFFGVLYFSGNIYYGGNPLQVDSDVQGSGQIAPL